MTENDNVLPGTALRRTLAVGLQLARNQEQVQQEAEILNRFLHSEQQRLGWGDAFMLFGTDTNTKIKDTVFGKMISRERLISRSLEKGYNLEELMEFADRRMGLHLLGCATYSRYVPDGIPFEVHASTVWPIDPLVWDQVVLHNYDTTVMPDWVTTHLHLARIAYRTHRAMVADEVDAALAVLA